MTIHLYWHRQIRNPNFGDAISPMIVEMLSGDRVVHADTDKCTLSSTGSVLWKVLAGYVRNKRTDPLHVWGSGLMQPIRLPLPEAVSVSAVRGPLTRYSLPGIGNIPLGDPGLLARELFDHVPTVKSTRIGLIPHQGEKDSPKIQALLDHIPGAETININGHDAKIIASNIKKCHFIISSSLHGIIVADSFGIPNIWLKLGDLHEASEYKFYDYFLSVDRPVKKYAAEDLLGNVREDIFDLASQYRISHMCDRLHQAFAKNLPLFKN